MSRIVVAVDPPVSGTERSDACGIVVAGVVAQGPVQDWRAYILEDVTVQGASPMAWAEAAVAAMHRWKAERMVAEAAADGAGGDFQLSVAQLSAVYGVGAFAHVDVSL